MPRACRRTDAAASLDHVRSSPCCPRPRGAPPMTESTEVAAWEERGRRLPLAGGDVWALDQPAVDDAGLDAVFVLHGFPTCSFDWRHVLPTLAARRRVVLFDFPGFGLSAKPDVRYRLRDQADVAEAVAAELGLERVALVTHDMGDSVGGELLARDLDGQLPFAVSGRVLTNGSIYLDLAQLTAGQLFLLDLPDAQLDAVGGDDGAPMRAALAATSAILDGVGHYPMIEAPERFGATVVRLLDADTD